MAQNIKDTFEFYFIKAQKILSNSEMLNKYDLINKRV